MHFLRPLAFVKFLYFAVLSCYTFFQFLPFSSFQFANTRSYKGEKEKEKERDAELDVEDQTSEADLSLMDRTKHHFGPGVSLYLLHEDTGHP